MTKYLPLVFASIVVGMALMALIILLVQSTDESTKAQMNYHKASHLMNTDCGDICRGA